MSIPEDELAYFSLTAVQYTAGDRLGLLLALFSLTPMCVCASSTPNAASPCLFSRVATAAVCARSFVMVSYVTLLVFRRDVQTVVALFGQLSAHCADPRPSPPGGIVVPPHRPTLPVAAAAARARARPQAVRGL